MISADTEARIQQLAVDQNAYQPTAEISAALQSKHIVMLVAACCQGKSTIVQSSTKLDNRFGMGGNLTTRPPRADDVRYTYYDHTDEGIGQLATKIENRELVQYAVNPTGYIYGSELEDYDHTYTVKDVLSGAVDGFRHLTFASSLVITVVSKPDEWLRRVNERFPKGSKYRVGRLAEAAQSFEWSLRQPIDTGMHFWVENITDKPEIATQTVIDIVLGKSEGNPSARALCEQSIALLERTT